MKYESFMAGQRTMGAGEKVGDEFGAESRDLLMTIIWVGLLRDAVN